MGDSVFTILAIVAFLFVFMALREFWCWYFKINEQIKLRQETNELLKKLLNK